MVAVAALTIIPESPIMNHGSATASAPIRNVNTGASRIATLCYATGSTSCLPSDFAYSSICLLKPATGLTASPEHDEYHEGAEHPLRTQIFNKRSLISHVVHQSH